MQRNLLTFALAAVFGLFLNSSDAQACHKAKKCAAPTPACYAAPAPVCAPAPIVCEQAPVCAPVVYAAPVVCEAPAKKCGLGSKLKGFKMPKFSLCKKKTAVCAAPVAYAAPACDTCGTSAPIYAAPQGYSSPQIIGSPQVYGSGQ